MNCTKFYINKYSYIIKEVPDMSFVPMLMRRKLDSIGKAGLYTLYNSFIPEIEHNLLFASCYGDIERVKKLIEQRQNEGEISPNSFSFSVHNATIGLFSLLNSLKAPYNSISAGGNTLSYSILEAVLSCKDKPTLFCYAESYPELKSIAFSCSDTPLTKQSFSAVLQIQKQSKSDSFSDFINFLENKRNDYNSDLYKLERI